MQCPDTTEIYFSAATNQCICKIKNVTPLLIHQATDQIPQQNATVYSVRPYFLDGVISFHLQLAGAPGGFNLNASTTIAADNIGIDPEPNLVLVPKNLKSRVPKSAEETATVIAVTFNSDDSIGYYVQLANGTIVKLYGDKFVHDIDLIDPNAPPTLSLLTSHALSHLKREMWDQYEDADPQSRAVPVKIERSGVEGISPYTATLSEGTCGSIICVNNGGKRAMFNPFLNTCYCQTLVPPVDGLDDLDSRAVTSESCINEDLARCTVDHPFPRSTFRLAQPSSETCPQMTTCPGESEPFFDESSSQCLCVVFRAGVKEPVIASDTTMLPRTEERARQDEGRYQDEGNSQAGSNEALSPQKRTDLYLSCTDKLHECPSDLHH